jgi:hypothetical protein
MLNAFPVVAERGHTVKTWRDFRVPTSASPAGGLSRRDANSTGPVTVHRGAASEGPSAIGES